MCTACTAQIGPPFEQTREGSGTSEAVADSASMTATSGRQGGVPKLLGKGAGCMRFVSPGPMPYEPRQHGRHPERGSLLRSWDAGQGAQPMQTSRSLKPRSTRHCKDVRNAPLTAEGGLACNTDAEVVAMRLAYVLHQVQGAGKAALNCLKLLLTLQAPRQEQQRSTGEAHTRLSSGWLRRSARHE